jgi:tRNA threonylcarbamoyladenosine biosynthesis protein TsaB
MKILAFDTSTDACSAAIAKDDNCAYRFTIAPQKHTELLLPMIYSLLQEVGLELSELDLLAFGHGPGSFTGIRLAASVAQGLSFGAKIKVVGISTLQVLAQAAFEEAEASDVLVIQDARMQQVYWGLYYNENSLMQPVIPDSLSASDQIIIDNPPQKLAMVGSGCDLYGDLIKRRFNVNKILSGYYPNARYLLKLAEDAFRKGKFTTSELAFPTYLRDQITSARS